MSPPNTDREKLSSFAPTLSSKVAAAAATLTMPDNMLTTLPVLTLTGVAVVAFDRPEDRMLAAAPVSARPAFELPVATISFMFTGPVTMKFRTLVRYTTSSLTCCRTVLKSFAVKHAASCREHRQGRQSNSCWAQSASAAAG